MTDSAPPVERPPSVPLTPFNRLARAHAAILAGDATVAVALAGTIFFSIDPNDARWRVALYLVLTMAPFAVVAPLISPTMDRLPGGNRWVIVGAAAARAALALVMIQVVDSLLLFPVAFSILVLGKAHMVAKSAIVPGMVSAGDNGEGGDPDSELVEANSKLALVGSLAGAIAAVPAAGVFQLFGTGPVLVLCAAIFGVGAALGWRLPATTVATQPPDSDEVTELRAAGIRLAAGAMGLIRGAMGFVTLFIAFEFRGGIDPGPTGTGVAIGHRVRAALGEDALDLTSGGSPLWHFGLALAAILAGNTVGAAGAPKLRRVVREERMLAGLLVAVAVASAVALAVGGLVGAILVAFVVSIASQGGKQAFDAIVQRDAPEANLGRSFGRFESRFQLIWVVGALLPAVFPLTDRISYAILGAVTAFAAVSYHLGHDPTALPVGLAGRRRRRRDGDDDSPDGPPPVPPVDPRADRDATDPGLDVESWIPTAPATEQLPVVRIDPELVVERSDPPGGSG